MILQRLYDYAHDMADKIPPRGMDFKEIEFVVVIDSGGRFLRLESKRIDKRRCAKFCVAKGVSRTSNPKANTLWDNGKYVLGIGDERLECYGLFAERIRQIATFYPDDISINALVKFYNTPRLELVRQMEVDPLFEDVKNSAGSNISFRLESEDCLIAEKQELFGRLDDEKNEESPEDICLVTGRRSPIVRTMTPTPIPGNSPMAALVAFQVGSGYDSYGKSQAYNAPISAEAEFYVTAALKKLLDKDSNNKVRIGTRTFLFWGSGNDSLDSEMESAITALLDMPDKEKSNPDGKTGDVIKLFKGIFSGEIKTTLDNRFHLLGLAPNTGRIAVVLWVECQLRQFAERIFAHFCDMEIVDSRKPESRRPYYGVYSMVSAVMRGGKLSDALPNLIDMVTDAVMNGTDYPVPLYLGAIERIRAELSDQTVTVARAAILKAYLNRKSRKTNNQKQLHIMLDKDNTNQGYLCGRLIAVLEKIQKDSESGDSIRTRYMGSASSIPTAVFPTVLNVSLHHSEKLSDGSRIYFEQLKQEIMDKLPPTGFPSHLNLDDQGRFFVGYYHQRADLYTKKIINNNNININ